MKLSGVFEHYVWELDAFHMEKLWEGYMVFRQGNGLKSGVWDDDIRKMGMDEIQIRLFNLQALFAAVTLRYACGYQRMGADVEA